MAHQQILQTYTTDLIEIIAALVFLVVFKLILVWGMSKVSKVVAQDEDQEQPKVVKPKQLPPPGFEWYRWIGGIVLVLNGLYQIRPVLIDFPPAQLLSNYTGWLASDKLGTTFAQHFATHSISLNIWSVIIQLAFGTLLLSFRQRMFVTIVFTLVTILSLASFVVAQNFGDLGAHAPSFFAGAPSASILLAIWSSFALLPRRYWESKQVERIASIVLVSYWVLFTIVNWLPWDKFWGPEGFNTLKAVPPIGNSLFSNIHHALLQALSAAPVISNLVVGLVALLFAWWTLASTKSTYTWSWFIITGIGLLFTWIVSMNVGAGTLFIFPLGAPFLILAMNFFVLTQKRSPHIQS